MKRPATHCGLWYTSNGSKLTKQIKDSFSHSIIPGTRILVGPHAGYTYSDQQLGESFSVLDLTNIKRIFILGPSHHVYFKNYVTLSPYKSYETPLGDLDVDTDVCKKLVKLSNHFKFMDEDTDNDEHSFEMHCPYIAYKIRDFNKDFTSDLTDLSGPKIIPIMVSSIDETSITKVVDSLSPYFQDKSNAFVISSDFCHWGSRFNYTKYLTKKLDMDLNNLEKVTLTKDDLTSVSSINGNLPIYKSIRNLDMISMSIASSGSSKEWYDYIKLTGNTICGQKPIYIVLKLLELHQEGKFKWLGYSQSSQVTTYFESSVSYASGYV